MKIVSGSSKTLHNSSRSGEATFRKICQNGVISAAAAGEAAEATQAIEEDGAEGEAQLTEINNNKKSQRKKTFST